MHSELIASDYESAITTTIEEPGRNLRVLSPEHREMNERPHDLMKSKLEESSDFNSTKESILKKLESLETQILCHQREFQNISCQSRQDFLKLDVISLQKITALIKKNEECLQDIAEMKSYIKRTKNDQNNDLEKEITQLKYMNVILAEENHRLEEDNRLNKSELQQQRIENEKVASELQECQKECEDLRKKIEIINISENKFDPMEKSPSKEMVFELLPHDKFDPMEKSPLKETVFQLLPEDNFDSNSITSNNFRTETLQKQSLNSQIPYQAVILESVHNLPNTGWKIHTCNSDNITPLQETKSSIISFNGSIGSGKTWLASKLSGVNLPMDSYSPSNSLHFYYIPKKGGCFGVLDNTGYDQPLYLHNQHTTNTDTSANINYDDDSDKKTYSSLINDSDVIEELKCKFLVSAGGINLIVVRDLTKKDMIQVQKALRWTGKIAMTRNLYVAPQLIVVHNFSWLTTRGQVEEQIELRLSKSFRLEKQPLFNQKLANQADLFYHLYKDEFGLTHLIMAAEGTEAGKYYNPSAIQFLTSKFDSLEIKESMNFPHKFAEFCNSELSQRAGCNLNIKFDVNKAIITAPMMAQDSLLRLRCEGDITRFISDKYTPRYSKKSISINPEETRITLDIELADCALNRNQIVCREGWYCLRIEGRKQDIFSEEDREEEEKMAANLMKGTREDGEFDITIPLSASQKPENINITNVTPNLKRFSMLCKKDDSEFWEILK